jgi:nitroimidazol reductase NimA-like FMN-containing flavoprotein (pyridoxamine 5'-phosphate oxidase superfamily)
LPAPEEPEANLVGSMEELDEAECLRLLASTTVGRVGFVVDDRPIVLPVNYALDGRTVVFRTGEGTVLNKAALHVIAFEVDKIDDATHSGWSVLAQGVAQDVGTAIDTRSEQLRRLALVTWAPDRRDRWFRLDAETLTGRRLSVHPA